MLSLCENGGFIFARHILSGGQVIIHERAVEPLPVHIVYQPLVKRIDDTLRHAAMTIGGVFYLDNTLPGNLPLQEGPQVNPVYYWGVSSYGYQSYNN